MMSDPQVHQRLDMRTQKAFSSSTGDQAAFSLLPFPCADGAGGHAADAESGDDGIRAAVSGRRAVGPRTPGMLHQVLNCRSQSLSPFPNVSHGSFVLSFRGRRASRLSAALTPQAGAAGTTRMANDPQVLRQQDALVARIAACFSRFPPASIRFPRAARA